MSRQKKKPENQFLNIAFNILLPVLVLNKLGPRLGEHGALWALAIGVALPVGYGIYDYKVRREKNWISLLGVINVLFSGGFALFKFEGSWFALKEAFFPLLIGVAVLISNMINKPFIKTLFWNEQILDIEKIEVHIKQKNTTTQLRPVFKVATYLFSLSFFISAALNYILARRIFTPLDPSLTDGAANAALNEQIAKMTWQGYIVIALPMMLFMGLILWYFLSQIKKISGLSVEELLPHDHSSSSPSK